MARNNRQRQTQQQHNQTHDTVEDIETVDQVEVVEVNEPALEEIPTINEDQQRIVETNQADESDIPTNDFNTPAESSPFEEVVVKDQQVEIQDLPSAHDLNKTKSVFGSIDLEALRKEVSLSGGGR